MVISAARAQIRSVDARPPQRDFGYFVGDLLVSTAVVDVGPDTVLDANSLPPAGPVSSTVDLRDIGVSEAAVSGGHRITIRTEWQIFSAPGEVSLLDIPGYQPVFIRGQSHLTAAVPGFRISVSPFRHDLQPVLDESVLRTDHPVAHIDVEPSRQMLFGSCAVALLAALYLIGSSGLWPWTRAVRAPFARAARAIARQPDGSQDALLLLHRAFDETAGERVLADDLDQFVIRQARFAPLRSDMEQFFAYSRRHFFGIGQDDSARPSLACLSRALARAERQ
jgi:mxaA protein